MALGSLVTAAFTGGPAVAGVIDKAATARPAASIEMAFMAISQIFPERRLAVLVREYMPRFKMGATGDCSREATAVICITARE
ncbi:hypothetical protein [Bradyrhizobium sp. S3.2.6]|uniref:hypothetical protein n=1 Tax=Bradyrhizobium sp. S3.2.6 TaxID=3156428 RepID=UPI0033961439